MSKNRFWASTLGLGGLAVAVAAFFILWDAAANRVSDPYGEFASCLTKEGLVMYGSDRCGYCNQQKNMFGDAFESIRYINCDFNQEMCRNRGVAGYPAWYLDNELYAPGLQAFTTLSEATGCPLPAIE